MDSFDPVALLYQLPLVAVVLASFIKGWIVTGREHAEMESDRTYWRSIALRLMNVAEKATSRGPNGD